MSLIDFFKGNKILVLDGATGSQLIARGLKPGECPEEWNVSNKENIKAIASLYFNAGSDAVLTNTFGGSTIKLKGYGLEERVYELNFAGAKNAIEAKPTGKFVFGSMGPTGAMLEPFGELTKVEMINAFTLQAKALVDAGVDGIMLETFTDLNEVDCALEAIRQYSQIPVIVSLTYTKSPMGYNTMMGTSIEDAVKHLSKSDVFAIGSNCGNGIENMIEVGKEIRKNSDKIKIMVKPNAGEPKLIDRKTSYSEGPEVFYNKANELLSFMPSMIGGCCGTTPEHIKMIRKIIDKN
jgi:5-methyltetrahydrofolate--homocysteine methyltransferase